MLAGPYSSQAASSSKTHHATLAVSFAGVPTRNNPFKSKQIAARIIAGGDLFPLAWPMSLKFSNLLADIVSFGQICLSSPTIT
jgi:hypothetical protein